MLLDFFNAAPRIKMSYDEVDKLTEVRATTFTFSDAESRRILFPEVPFSSETQAESYPTILEQIRKKETRSLLHGTVLSQYWRNSRIPRGLRINKEPTLGRENAEFCKKWCAILNKCSLDLMLLVIENENEKLLNIRKDLNSLTKDMKDTLSPDKFKDIMEDCDRKIERYKGELERQKMSKYRRDALDYRDGRVYTWLSGRTARPRQWRRTAQPDITSASSEGLSTDTESTSVPFLRPRLRSQLQPTPQPSSSTRGKKPGGARGKVRDRD